MQVSDLRGILQYIPRFRDRTFVIAIDGEIIESENFSNVLLDLAVLRSLSIRVVIVHGARHQIEQRAAELGQPITNADGAGVTDEPTLSIALDAATRVTHEIMEGLTSVDLRAVYANAVIAYPAGILGGVDQLYTGRVDRVDAASLQLFLDQGMIPIVPPLGFDGDGKTYRINSDSVAVEIAEALRAAKIIFLCEGGSLRLDDGQLVRQLSVEEAERPSKSTACKSPTRARSNSSSKPPPAPAARASSACTCSTATSTRLCSPNSSAARASGRWFIPTSTNTSGARSKRTCAASSR